MSYAGGKACHLAGGNSHVKILDCDKYFFFKKLLILACKQQIDFF